MPTHELRMKDKVYLSCICIYDWAESLGQGALFLCLFDFVMATKLNVAICEVTLPGATRSRKMKVEALLKRIEDGEVMESIEIYFGERTQGRDLAANSDGFLRMARGPGPKKHCVASLLPELATELEWDALIARLAHLGHLVYGAAFAWRRRSHPAYYAVGITHCVPGPDGVAHAVPQSSEEEQLQHDNMLWTEERISRMGAAPKMRYRVGYFRDVYERNIVNATHVNHLVDGRSLGEIISSTPGWGTLRAFENGNWLWSVDESALTWIRQKFEQWKLLVRCL